MIATGVHPSILPTMSTPAALPPFQTVLKSREVEDPINLWLHRPLAYAFVALVYRSSITPNQITLMSVVAGCGAAICFVVGTPGAMLLGGLLLWTSAILDGADGILARAKRMFSDFGRSLDGGADAVVAVSTVGAAYYHIWMQWQNPVHLALMPFAFAISIVEVYLYDYYKEAYLQHTNPAWNGVAERAEDVRALYERLKARGVGWPARLSTLMHAGVLEKQIRVVGLTNPDGLRTDLSFPVNAESIEIYRRNNAKAMQLWATVSLAPHCYTMSVCAMFDRLDVYLWLRAVGFTLLLMAALVWQRHASRRTRSELAAAGLAPIADLSNRDTDPADLRPTASRA
jgi:phosphatidylglycerophosphate synthase